MDITPRIAKHRQRITGYGVGGFKINDVFIAGSLLVFPEKTIPWDVKKAEDITLESLALLIVPEGIELLLIGTGEHAHPLDPALRPALKARGIALDIMNTGAACRTYNVLLAEERRLAAAVVTV